jgi:hypothetical protein
MPGNALGLTAALSGTAPIYHKLPVIRSEAGHVFDSAVEASAPNFVEL